MQSVIVLLAQKPRTLFFIDMSGAAISAFMLGVVLVHFQNLVGLPSSSLYFLALFPCGFMVFDIYCLAKTSIKLASYLKGIAIANLLYCGISIFLIILNVDIITFLGGCYFTIEILIVFGLSALEYEVSKKI